MTEPHPVIPVLIVAEMTTGEPGDRVTTRFELGTISLDNYADNILTAMRQVPEALRDLADSWDTRVASMDNPGVTDGDDT